MPKLTISEASKQWSVGRSTLYRAIQRGTISVSHVKGAKKLDIAELLRVYGEPADVPKSVSRDTVGQSRETANTAEIAALKRENAMLRDQLTKAEDREAKLTAVVAQLATPKWKYLLPWSKK